MDMQLERFTVENVTQSKLEMMWREHVIEELEEGEVGEWGRGGGRGGHPYLTE